MPPSHPANRAATRGIVALSLMSLLAPQAGALTPALPDVDTQHFAPPVWASPAPRNAFVRDRAALRLDRGPMGAPSPTFHAPSATSCQRPVRSHEELGSAPPSHANGLAIARGGSPRSRVGGMTKAEIATESIAMPAPAATADAVAPPVAEAPSPMAAPSPATGAMAPARKPARGHDAPAIDAGPVTAGMVDDNASFADYLAFRERTQVTHRPVDVRERVLLQVRDPRGRAVPDAEVIVRATNGTAMWARTDTGGRAWISPDAFDYSPGRFYEVTVRQGKAQSSVVLERGQKSAVDVILNAKAPAQRAWLDLVFLIDATGSMADEIAKLKATLRTIADEVARLPSRPDTCFGLVAYRDKTDDYLLRSHDFTGDLNAFQGVLDQLQAAGGGDEPEAMNEALFEAVHALSWRGPGATRLMVLLADAPPHLDYQGPQYDESMRAALGKGIKVFSVGASGLNQQGEFIQRQIAQYTGGRFVFLTYRDARNPASGPGRETVHDVNNYSVETLDRLVVRLVSDELAQLPAPKP